MRRNISTRRTILFCAAVALAAAGCAITFLIYLALRLTSRSSLNVKSLDFVWPKAGPPDMPSDAKSGAVIGFLDIVPW